MSKTVVLIHGAWLTPAAWDSFRTRYEGRGFTCVAPGWPLNNRPIAELQRSPHPDLRKLTVGKIVDHYAELIRDLPEPPILIGHSFGGLFVQMLLDRGLGAAGVAIDPAPARGVLPGLIALRSALPVLLAWNGWNRVLTMPPESFGRDFAQLLPAAEKPVAYERHIVPAPGRILFQAAFGISNAVNFENAERAPLLLIAGDADRTVERSMVQATYRQYARSQAVTAFKSFPNRAHWLILERGWEEIADYAIEWASTQIAVAPRYAASFHAQPERSTALS